MKRRLLFVCVLMSSVVGGIQAQTNIVDEIVAVVGDEPILKSNIETEYQRMQYDGQTFEGDAKCKILENLLIQNLLLTQAKFDSVTVSEERVLSQVDQRINFFISQIGSQEKMEEYFGKKTVAIKEELMDTYRNQMITEQMTTDITKGVRVTPTEIRNYYNKIPKDSLPNIKTQYEVQMIYVKPKISREEIDRVKTQLREYQDRVKAGDDFATLAILYSEDPGSRQNGGELGFMGKAQLVPEYANVAFNLKTPGDVSKVVETEFGFHIIQLIERRGNRINTRHILIKPKISDEARQAAIQEMDSIATITRNDSMSFDEAAFRFSADKDTRSNGGLMSNPHTGSPQFDITEMNGDVAKAVESLKPNEISKPFKMTTQRGQEVYAIVKLKNKIEGHVANLSDDYQTIKNMYLSERKNVVLGDWIKKKQTETYISIDPKWRKCTFEHANWVK